MDMDNDALFDIFKIAILKEHEAYEFYTNSAKRTAHMEAKQLFEKFAAMELRHKQALEDLYKTLKK